MNILDILIIMVLLSFFAVGFKNGVIKEAISFLGIILVFVISYILKDYIGNYLCLYAPFIKFGGALEDLSSFNIFMYQAIAFLIAFSLLLGIYEILVKTSIFVQKIVNMTIVLILPSKILGGIIGILKGWLLLIMILILLMLPLGNNNIVRESTLTRKILYETPVVSAYTEKFTMSLKEIFETIHKVAKKEVTSKKANVKCLDIMMKYKMVSKQTVEELIEKDKIESNEDIKSLLNKY